MVITKEASEARQFIVGKEVGKYRIWCHEIVRSANKITSADLGWVRCFVVLFFFTLTVFTLS